MARLALSKNVSPLFAKGMAEGHSERLSARMKNDSSAPANAMLPFLKWAGGKRWLCRRYSHLFPKKFDRYVEPFVGSGAVFFHLRPKIALLSDSNPELINTYKMLRSSWRKVYAALSDHSSLHSDEYYYDVRKNMPDNNVDRAARFLYLNRTCWNGLYRVNKKGIFNVPRGTKDQVLLPTDRFPEVASHLRNKEIILQDYRKTLDECGDGDFVFIDPPYTVAHNVNGFIKYNDDLFTWQDQIELRDKVKLASDRGARVLITNADHESIKILYQSMGTQIALDRATIISGNAAGRKATTELAIVVGYRTNRVGGDLARPARISQAGAEASAP